MFQTMFTLFEIDARPSISLLLLEATLINLQQQKTMLLLLPTLTFNIGTSELLDKCRALVKTNSLSDLAALQTKVQREFSRNMPAFVEEDALRIKNEERRRHTNSMQQQQSGSETIASSSDHRTQPRLGGPPSKL